MAHERITERTDGVTSERVVERGEDRVVVERRGGSGAVIALLLIVAVAIGAYFFLRADGRDAAQSAAITDAAQSVGDAADEAGAAVKDAVK